MKYLYMQVDILFKIQMVRSRDSKTFFKRKQRCYFEKRICMKIVCLKLYAAFCRAKKHVKPGYKDHTVLKMRFLVKKIIQSVINEMVRLQQALSSFFTSLSEYHENIPHQALQNTTQKQINIDFPNSLSTYEHQVTSLVKIMYNKLRLVSLEYLILWNFISSVNLYETKREQSFQRTKSMMVKDSIN